MLCRLRIICSWLRGRWLTNEGDEGIVIRMNLSFFGGGRSGAFDGTRGSALRRDALMSAVRNPSLRNSVNQLYRPGAKTGDGGTAAALRHEIQTGQPLTHLIKTQERIRNLENIKRTQTLSASDLKIVNELLSDLKHAVGLIIE